MTSYADLAELLRVEGPVASVYLESPSAVEDARARLDTAWGSARRELEAAGADDATLKALDDLVAGVTPRGSTLVAFAAGGRILHASQHPESMDRSVVRFGDLPLVTPILSWRADHPSHVVVRVDRAGADITAYERAEAVAHGTVEGETEHATRVHAGGWSQRRYQQRAENQWETNAKAVAEQVEEAARLVDAELVVVTGDVRMVQLLTEHLSPPVRDLVHVVEGGRGAEAATGTFDDAVEEAITAVTARTLAELLATFAEERGQADRAADGREATVTALQSGQADTLLLTDPTGGGRVAGADEDDTLWYGPEPTMVATSKQALEVMGVESPKQGPATDVLVWAAIGTGADVRLVPPEATDAPTDGVGAILRWS